MNEIEKIKSRYESRKSLDVRSKYTDHYEFVHYSRAEREFHYGQILKQHFGQGLSETNMLEIGAGHGDNLLFFNRIGLEWKQIYANELLEDRCQYLERNFPLVHMLPGDATQIQSLVKFDIVFQSTVFTSILDEEFKKQLAKKCWQMLKPRGLLLWYDFSFDNPKNPDVKGIKLAEIEKLFPEGKMVTHRNVTLAPPLGRRVKSYYNLFNTLCPFLRTHRIVALTKTS